MRRREFIRLFISSVVAWPLTARAQQTAMPVIGLLYVRSPEDSAPQLAAFRRGLAENGFVESKNVAIEYRWGLGHYDRMPAMAAELVRLPVNVILAGAEPSALAAKAATSTIPIVFVVGSDPVKLHLVASYNSPGGNATGVNIFTTNLDVKRLGLLNELMPSAKLLGVLVNPKFPYAQDQLDQLEAAANAAGLHLQIYNASNPAEIDAAFEAISRDRIPALSVTADPFFDTRGDQLIALAAQHAVPVMYQFRQYPQAGGLMSYGVDLPDAYRQGRNLRWPGSKGCETCRIACAAAKQIRIRNQSQDRQGSRACHSVGRTRNRGRGDRITPSFPQRKMSAFDPKRTFGTQDCCCATRP
jgi:putative tryptophan/tyrosine transport system substrate-binding protein